MADVKKGDTVVLAGTRKGLFVAHSRDRRRWKVSAPHFAGVNVHSACLASDGKTIQAAVESSHWGPTVQRSASWGTRWLKPDVHPKYPEGAGRSVERVWQVTPGEDGDLFCGVEPAGLFRSDDGGATWKGVDGYNTLEGRDKWTPGGGGLNLHTILPYPGDPRRMIVAASAVGVFGTNDGGTTWRVMNGDVRADYLPAKHTGEAEIGSCPHKIVRDGKDPDVLYMQNHCGVYRRKRGDRGWTDISKALPSLFGFSMAAHPHDAGTVYTVPLVADMQRTTHDGAMAVWRTRDGGKKWARLSKGLPQRNAWLTVLREGLATDGNDPAGVYVGTTGGHLWASRDEGAAWAPIAEHLPPILSVRAGIVGGR